MDVDGVVSDFVRSFIGVYNSLTTQDNYVDLNFAPSYWDWCFDKSICPDVEAVTKAWQQPALFGDQELFVDPDFLIKLYRERYILFVTDVASSKEVHIPARLRWFSAVFGHEISSRDIIATPHKHLVRGSALIEDNVDNLISWADFNPNGKLVLVSRSWNVTWREKLDDVGLSYEVVSSLEEAFDGWTKVPVS